MDTELFYRFALTDPYTAIEAFRDFPNEQRQVMVINVYATLLLYSFGGRVPTMRERRQAVRHLTAELGRSYRKEIKALVALFNGPYAVTGREAVYRSSQLMIHIAAAICTRADFTDEEFNALIADLVANTDATAHR